MTEPIVTAPAGVAAPHRLVRASAGSGKTHRLATRYLEILFSGGRPESIVAATFTREAAGEILGRVLVRLAAATADVREAQRLGAEIGRADLARPHCERALRSLCAALDRAVVSTLDSFFFRLVAALRFELGLRGVPAVAALDDPLLASMREEALEATLVSLADRDWSDLVDLFERLHGAAARRSVARSLDALLLELYEIYQEAEDGALWGRLALPPAPQPAALAAALARLEDFLRASAPGALRRALADDLEHARRGDWERFLERGLAAKIVSDPGAARYGSAAIPAAWAAALAVVVAHARRSVLESRIDRTRATHRLLDVFHRHYWKLRRGSGRLLFSDLAAVLARWLPSRSSGALEDLYYRIDGRVGHLLLDEFQDTSLAQWSVLRPIAEEIRAWGDGSRTFFCVGDPKQAIYGWRGGCADLFDQIEQDLELEPGSGERLQESFRSSPVVLEVTNLVFGGLGRVEALAEHRETVARWSAAFGPHRARLDLPGYAELVESPADEDHLEWAARRVDELVAAVPRASMAVLVQTNEQATAMLEALRRRGVEASGEGAGAVADDPAVAAVVAALRLADHPGDTVAAFHVASCPLGAAIGLRSREPSAVMDSSRRLRGAFVERGARALLGEWKRALGGVCTRRSLARLEQAVDLAARFESEGGGRPADLAAFLTRALVESPRQRGVRVMTIHRAKGLEFDTVILPALERPLLRGVDTPVYLVRRSPLAPAEAVHRSAPASVRRLAPELEAGYQQERARRLRDDLSALYVGLTRARHTLHLWVEPPAARAGGGAAGAPLSFAAILRGTLVGSSCAPSGALYRAGSLDAVAKTIGDATRRARSDRQRVLPLAAPARSRRDPLALRPAIRIEELGAPATQRAATLLAPPDSRSGAREDPWRTSERSLGPLPPATPTALAGARSWLFEEGRSLELLEKDRRILARVGGTTVSGTLPRVWWAVAAGRDRRAIVGLDEALLGSADVATPQAASRSTPWSATLELCRRAVARGLSLESAQVGLLSRGAEPVFLPPLRGGSGDTP